MFKHGIAVMRCQPFHIGHERIVDEMLKQCEMITIILGSTNVKDAKNPWAFHERKRMIKNIYHGTDAWKKMRIIGAPDINDDMRWPRFIIKDVVKEYYVDELEMEDYPGVDAYFAGSEFDLRWFKHEKLEVLNINRLNQEFPFVSGTMVRDMGILQDSRWKLYVNKANHEIVQKHFDWIKWDRL